MPFVLHAKYPLVRGVFGISGNAVTAQKKTVALESFELEAGQENLDDFGVFLAGERRGLPWRGLWCFREICEHNLLFMILNKIRTL